jgi:hypothetical protein
MAGNEVEIAAKEGLFGRQMAIGDLGDARDHVSVRLETIRRPACRTPEKSLM